MVCGRGASRGLSAVAAPLAAFYGAQGSDQRRGILTLGGVLLTYAAARRLYGRTAGLTSATVLGTSLLYFGTGRFLVLDMAVSVLMSATLFCFILAVAEPPGARRRPSSGRPDSTIARVNATRRLRRTFLKKWMRQHFGQQFIGKVPARRPSAVLIVCLSAMAEGQDDSIKNHVSRASVECNYLLQFRLRWQECQISDTADILHDSWPRFIGEERPIRKRHQRRALPPCRHIPHPTPWGRGLPGRRRRDYYRAEIE